MGGSPGGRSRGLRYRGRGSRRRTTSRTILLRRSAPLDLSSRAIPVLVDEPRGGCRRRGAGSIGGRRAVGSSVRYRSWSSSFRPSRLRRRFPLSSSEQPADCAGDYEQHRTHASKVSHGAQDRQRARWVQRGPFSCSFATHVEARDSSAGVGGRHRFSRSSCHSSRLSGATLSRSSSWPSTRTAMIGYDMLIDGPMPSTGV